MSQENREGRIADDFPSIAARLRELNSQCGQVPARLGCGTCDNRGWVWSNILLDWSRCLHCGTVQRFPKPRPRR
jgi:hypothetical protein